MDFIKDEFFVKWVLNPDQETDRYWKQWIADHPEKQNEMIQARNFLEKLHYEDRYKLDDEVFVNIHEDILRFKKTHDLGGKGKHRILPSWWWAAAVLCLFVFALGVMEYYGENEASTKMADTYITRETPNGVKQTVGLPDGTIVKLNSGSSIRFPENFDNDRRIVYFEGEAFFDVAKDPQKPFVIFSGDMQTQVLGTSFNLRAYSYEAARKVAVVSGRVKVAGPHGQSVTLSPDQMAVYNKEKQEKITIEAFNTKQELGWKDGLLYFNDTPIKDVLIRLEVWYGVSIEAGERVPMGDIYNGEFKDETLENVLSGIGYTSGFNYKIEGENIYIYKK